MVSGMRDPYQTLSFALKLVAVVPWHSKEDTWYVCGERQLLEDLGASVPPLLQEITAFFKDPQSLRSTQDAPERASVLPATCFSSSPFQQPRWQFLTRKCRALLS